MSQEGSKQLFWASDTKARYLKWEIVATQADTYFQVSELRFIDQEANIFQWPSEVVCIDHSSWLTTGDKGIWYTKDMGHECAEKLFDLNVETKFCCDHKHQVPFFVAFDLGSECLDISLYNRYQWYTANDCASYQRSPTSWKVWLSNDYSSWKLVDEVYDFTAPLANLTLAYTSSTLTK